MGSHPWGRDMWGGVCITQWLTGCHWSWSDGSGLCRYLRLNALGQRLRFHFVCLWSGTNNTCSYTGWSIANNKVGTHSKPSINIYCSDLYQCDYYNFCAQLLTWGELIWTGGILNSLEGVQGGVWGQFSLTARKMLWVHPGPSGGKGETCKEELHIGSSFASVWAASPCLNRCIPSRAPFYLSLPLFCPGFLLFNSSNSPLLLKSLSGGWVRSYTTFGTFQVCLYETWRWSLNSMSVHKSVCVHPLHVFTYLKNDFRQTRIEDHQSSTNKALLR